MESLPRFGKTEIGRAAALARLRLSEEEIERFAAELAPVLEQFERIEASGPPPEVGSRGRGREPRLRRDRVDPDERQVPVSDGAPDWREGFFVVPRYPAVEK